MRTRLRVNEPDELPRRIGYGLAVLLTSGSVTFAALRWSGADDRPKQADEGTSESPASVQASPPVATRNPSDSTQSPEAAIRQLALFDAGAAVDLLIASIPEKLDLDAAARLARSMGFPATMIRRIFGRLSPKDADSFLHAYLRGVSPGVAPALAETFKRVELSERCVLTMNVLLLAVHPSFFDSWTAGADAETRRKLLDAAWKKRPFGGRTAAYYLDHRLGDPPFDRQAVQYALWRLPTGTDISPWWDKLPDDLRIAYESDQTLDTDPASGFESLLSAPKDLRSDLCQNFAAKLRDRDVDACVDGILKIPDPELRALLTNGLFSYGWTITPEVESRLWAEVASSERPHDYQPSVNRTLQDHLLVSPSETISLYAQLPDKARGEALAPMVQNWARLDAAAAGNWLETQPSSEFRDRAMAAVVAADPTDPEKASAAIADMRDPQARRETAEAVIRAWRDIDPESVTRLISESGLGDDEIRILNSSLSGDKPEAQP
ncbi:MAG: hypothetical protein ABI680_00510 [Chthoniobacteraceae bacterium]